MNRVARALPARELLGMILGGRLGWIRVVQRFSAAIKREDWLLTIPRSSTRFSRGAATEYSPPPALSEAEGAQAVGEKWDRNQPRRGERAALTHPLPQSYLRNFPNFSAAASSVSNFLQKANRTCRAPSRASR